MKKTFFGSRLYSVINDSLFWLAAAVSAVLCIVVLTQIDPVNVFDCVIFGIISVIVEGNKIVNIIRRNILSSLYKKVKTRHIKAKETRYLVTYILGAVFAILITAGFSFKAVQSSTSAEDTQISIINTQIETLSQASESYASAKGEYERLDSLINERNGAIRTASSKEEKDVIYKKYIQPLGSKYSSYQGDWTIGGKYDSNYVKAKDAEKSAKEAYDRALATAGGKTVPELKIELANLSSQKDSTGGASIIFENYAGLLNMDSNKFKTYLIIFLSLLVEITIFLCSPSMTIDKSILYKFKDDLPDETDIKSLLKEIDDELEVYSYSSNMKLSGAEKRALKEKIDEAKEKAYEEYDRKYEKIIDRSKRDHLEEIGKYKNEVKQLEAKIKEYADIDSKQKIEADEDDAVEIPVVEKNTTKVRFVKVDPTYLISEEHTKEADSGADVHGEAEDEEAVVGDDKAELPVVEGEVVGEPVAESREQPVLDAVQGDGSSEKLENINDIIDSTSMVTMEDKVSSEEEAINSRVVIPAEDELNDMLGRTSSKTKVIRI